MYHARKNSHRAVVMLITLMALACAWAVPGQAQTSASSSEPNPWEFKATLYLWISGVDGTVYDDAGVGTPLNASFSDLVENLKLGGMANFRGSKGNWGFDVDFLGMAMEATSPGVAASGDIDVKMDMILGEADFTLGVPSLHFVAGVRVLNVDQSLSFPVGPSTSSSSTIADPVLGARGEWPLSETWTFLLRGDVGGWGVGSELTYQVLYGASWKFADHWSLDFGYRLLGYDIKNDDLSMDMVMHGLVVGVGLNF